MSMKEDVIEEPEKYATQYHLELAYVAGHFGGEGKVVIQKNPKETVARWKSGRYTNARYTLCIGVINTNKQTIDWLKAMFGGCIYYRKKSGNRQDAWRWQSSGLNAYNFLKRILPYLRQKKPRAELGIFFYENASTNRGSYGNGKGGHYLKKKSLEEKLFGIK